MRKNLGHIPFFFILGRFKFRLCLTILGQFQIYCSDRLNRSDRSDLGTRSYSNGLGTFGNIYKYFRSHSKQVKVYISPDFGFF